MLLELLIAIIIAVVTWLLFLPPQPPLLGIYSQPGNSYVLKKVLARILLWLDKKRIKKYGHQLRNVEGRSENVSENVSQETYWHEIEQAQKLSCDNEWMLDCAYFNGMAADGSWCVLRIGRRSQSASEVWLTLFLPSLGYLQLPSHPDTLVYDGDSKSFNAGGLKLQCLEPRRRWRITFNGLLRKGLQTEWSLEQEDLVHVTFNLRWSAFSDTSHFDLDLNSGLIAEAIAREQWTGKFWKTLKERHLVHYEQWGDMAGQIKVDNQMQELYLRGCRDHTIGLRDWRWFQRYLSLFCYVEDGRAFHIGNFSMKDSLTFIRYGYFMRPNGSIHAITWMDLDIRQMLAVDHPPDTINFSFTAAGQTINVSLTFGVDIITLFPQADWQNVIYYRRGFLRVNGSCSGHFLAEYCFYREHIVCPIRRPTAQSISDNKSRTVDDPKLLAVNFSNPVCCNSAIVGGKGAQLAFLTQLHAKSYQVPNGFCLTFTYFDQLYSENEQVQKVVKIIELISSGQMEGNLKQACEDAGVKCSSISISEYLRNVVCSSLTSVFGEKYDAKSYAVRSSASGEDGEELSFAGQMETFLGVKTIAKIYQAILGCWASHFSFTAVEYRRQHGQPINSKVAVVIQEMVDSDISGVLFTHNPITGNPLEMVINANYGLGESVVSGICQPDTFSLSRSFHNSIQIIERQLGQKKNIIKMSETNGTEVISQSDSSDSSQLCLSDEAVLKLATIGLQIEKQYSSPRDIEWAIKDDCIYILQARPITTQDAECDEDIIHEFDRGISYDGVVFTTCNISEVLPGALTPLTLSAILAMLEKSYEEDLVRIYVLPRLPAHGCFIGISCSHGLLSLMSTGALSEANVLLGSKSIAELSLTGSCITDLSMQEIIAFNGSLSFPWRTWNFIRQSWSRRNASNNVKQWDVKSRWHIPEGLTAAETFAAICSYLPDLKKCVKDHLTNSSNSAIWASVIMSILSKGKLEWTTEMYSDMTVLLGKCDEVISADVPYALQKLITKIKDANLLSEMMSRTTDEATKWLQSPDSGVAGVEFEKFLVLHGHRSFRECELRETSWRTDPTKIVKILQTMMKHELTKKPEHSSNRDGSLDKLQSLTTLFGRFILKMVIPRARLAVGKREQSKSYIISMIDSFKTAYRQLAKLMVQEGYLPDEDLIFFFTHYELGLLLSKRSPKFIIRAKKRRRLLPQMMELKLPRITKGRPLPVIEKAVSETGALKFQGMPVSQGVVTGVARVIKSLDEAESIQTGDILIVPFTDIGWSPYFPLISGLVTEIGGLISHGAVIAREYGLPCVVNIASATNIFKSGDIITVNGSLGTVEKLSSVEVLSNK